MRANETAAITRAYHDAWTTKEFAGAAGLLAGTLVVEVPVNHYPTTSSFAAALTSFGSVVTKVRWVSIQVPGPALVFTKALLAGDREGPS
jgi:hypothetical protein